MRKILTNEEIIKRDQKRNKVLTIVMLLILVVSTAGYAFLSINPNSSDTSGNLVPGKVQNYGTQWVVAWSGNQHVFSSSPESAFNATELNFVPDINKYYGKPLYIDSKSDLMINEIASNLGVYSERVNKACYKECNNSELAEKDCNDNLIIYVSGDENKITQKDNCIFITGDVRAVDAFLYREIGIA